MTLPSETPATAQPNRRRQFARSADMVEGVMFDQLDRISMGIGSAVLIILTFTVVSSQFAAWWSVGLAAAFALATLVFATLWIRAFRRTREHLTSLRSTELTAVHDELDELRARLDGPPTNAPSLPASSDRDLNRSIALSQVQARHDDQTLRVNTRVAGMFGLTALMIAYKLVDVGEYALGAGVAIVDIVCLLGSIAAIEWRRRDYGSR